MRLLEAPFFGSRTVGCDFSRLAGRLETMGLGVRRGRLTMSCHAHRIAALAAFSAVFDRRHFAATAPGPTQAFGPGGGARRLSTAGGRDGAVPGRGGGGG